MNRLEIFRAIARAEGGNSTEQNTALEPNTSDITRQFRAGTKKPIYLIGLSV
ncbi:hypothetical protein IFR41_02835 [Pseudomonas fluorescens]|uniref:hypothetical protein n=1 Tax=Pseudomonas simiae TaxID=321846 RepID=UPI00130E9E11|nr:hypothetical protein [Pseudomonas simiae]MBD8738442.1 hypothetical protein [Pseudomonas fluorescens]WLH99393.1 hypothetical protein PSH95_18320 [Pseudomonas simiae]